MVLGNSGRGRVVGAFFLVMALFLYVVPFQAVAATEADPDPFADEWNNDNGPKVSDPLEPVNRVIFEFNDRLYFWVIKPAAQGYSYFIAEDVRICVRDFIHNIFAPVRIVNNLLQGKFKNSGTETARFLINSTVGIAGLADPAKREFGIEVKDEDFGQTLGHYGLGEGIYLVWPIIGPSNVRDSIGLVGDSFLTPFSYIDQPSMRTGIALYAGTIVNNTSLVLGDYEDFKAGTIDPYVALRDAYHQNRQKKIRDDVVNDSLYTASYMPVSPAWFDSVPETDYVRAAESARDADSFFVQIGTAVDAGGVVDLQERLLACQKKAVVRIYDRGDYKFYGVQVPAGRDFEAAKRTEQGLFAAGFTEARLAQH